MLELPGIHACFVGNSIVAGVCDPDGLGWTGRVVRDAASKGVPIVAYNLGIRGNTSENLKARWYQEVFRRLHHNRRGKVVFSFGINDTVILQGKRRVSFEETKTNASIIFEKAKEKYATYMISPTPLASSEQNKVILEVHELFLELCQNFEIPYCNVWDSLIENSAWFEDLEANDGAHPKSCGYQMLADLIIAWEAWQLFLNDEEGERVA